jgi:hypothetical protein
MPGQSWGARAGVVALAFVVAAVAVAFLGAVAPWSSDDFGYSLDGFNGSVWGLGARAAADDPIGSRLGGVHPGGERYANHPPITVWTAAIGSAVSGDRPGAVRAPALIASVGALLVLALLLHDAGLRREAVAAGVVLTGTSGMFLTYGAMLDTPVVGLPFGLAALAAAQRVWQGRSPPRGVLVLVGALAALAGWQAALAAALASGVALLAPEPVGEGRSRRRGALALNAGVAVGTALTAGWIAWVYGGLGPLFDQAQWRTGQDGFGTDAPWGTAMGDHLTDLYGPTPVLLLIAAAVLVALASSRPRPVPAVVEPPEGAAEAEGPAAGGEEGDGCATGDGVAPEGGEDRETQGAGGPGDEERAAVDAGRRWRRPVGLRPVALVLVLTVVGYTLAFRNGAAVHDYWSYWGIALVGVGGAAVVDVVLVRTPLRRLPHVVTAVLVAAALVPLALAGHDRRTTAETRTREGLELLPVLGEVPPPEDPRTVAVAVMGATGELPWAEHLVHGRAVLADDLPALRRVPPRLPVLVVLRGPASPALREIAIAGNRRFVLVRAGALVRHLDR